VQRTHSIAGFQRADDSRGESSVAPSVFAALRRDKPGLKLILGMINPGVAPGYFLSAFPPSSDFGATSQAFNSCAFAQFVSKRFVLSVCIRVHPPSLRSYGGQVRGLKNLFQSV
jgi:hypothetical protein